MTRLWRPLTAIIAQQAGGGGGPPPEDPLPCTDTFTRTEATGWGTPDDGAAWSVNTPSIFSVGSNRGNMALTNTSYHRALRGASVLAVDQDMEISQSAFSDSSAGIELRILARYQNESNYYCGCVHIRTARVSVWIRKRISGSDTDYGYVFTHINAPSSSDVFHVRFDVDGDGSEAVMNLYVGQNSNAGSVSVTRTESSGVLGAGDCGIANYVNATMTNNPTLYVDNYAAS